MNAVTCPHCGAPPPPGFVVPAGPTGYRCAYCNQTSTLPGSAPAASQAPQPPQTGPIYIVNFHGSDDDDDDDDYDHYVPPPVVYRPSRTWIIWVVLVVLFGGGGTGVWRYRRGSVGQQILSGMSAQGWDGNSPLVCSGNDDIQLSSIDANLSAGTAIQASGNCKVRCTDCTITAPVAIDATGNAEVVIMNGAVKGTTTLANASGNAHVTIAGNVTASGPTTHSGSGSVTAPAQPKEPAAKEPVAAKTPAQQPAPAASGSAPATAKTKKPAAKKR